MKITLAKKKAAAISADLLVLVVEEGKEDAGFVSELSAAEKRTIKARGAKVGFKAKKGKSLSVQGPERDLLLLGAGSSLKKGVDWRSVGARARAAARAVGARSLAVRVPSDPKAFGAVAEGLGLADYRFTKYKSSDDKGKRDLRSVTLFGADLVVGAANRAVLARSLTVVESTCLARDLVNEMSAVKTPTYLGKVAKRIARQGGLRCEVWQGARLRKEKMNGILAVSAGSKEPGALIKLVYKPRGKAVSKIAVVGKGITFDSGGLSLKPGKGMETMKLDMAGAAAVLGLMNSLAVLRPQVEVHAFIASAENMPSGTALRPGDVIRYRNGKTAEVLNTDAEGRLVLADALCLAEELKPDAIVDLATLTGACLVALGTQIAGLLGNDDKLADQLLAASETAGEKLWRLPLANEYAGAIRSSVADMKNIGGGYAGTITAALFLKEFVGKAKWAHLDIAGPAFAEQGSSLCPRGGTGFAVGTLLAWVESLG
jgi:leucyl aminopeptidase